MERTVTQIVDLLNSGNLFASVVFGNSFPPAPGSLRGRVRKVAVIDNNFTIQADLPSKNIAEVSIPLENLDIIDTEKHIMICDLYEAGGHVIALEP